LAALTSSKVLAALVLGGWLLPEILNRWRTARLADRVLSSAGLTGSKGSSHWGSREADWANKR
jgi:hypothetical protein